MPQLEAEQIQVRKEIIRLQGGKRLQRVGGSLALLIPAGWAEANGLKIDGAYYIKFSKVSANVIQIEPLDRVQIEAMLEGVTVDE